MCKALEIQSVLIIRWVIIQLFSLSSQLEDYIAKSRVHSTQILEEVVSI